MRTAFTLIELVVVIIVVAIIAAASIPCFVDRSEAAREAALLQSLRQFRTGIELHLATHGSLPGDLGTEADFEQDLQGYLTPLPANPFKQTNAVHVKSDGAAMTGTVNGPYGWRYDSTSGEFRANSNGMSSDNARRYWQL